VAEDSVEHGHHRGDRPADEPPRPQRRHRGRDRPGEGLLRRRLRGILAERSGGAIGAPRPTTRVSGLTFSERKYILVRGSLQTSRECSFPKMISVGIPNAAHENRARSRSLSVQ
jgi:hypothetical protein